MRRIGVVTTGRADYGIYLPILKEIQQTKKLKLQLFVTGMHLSARFGKTVHMILTDGFPVAAKIPTLSNSDGPTAIAEAMGKTTLGFARVFEKNRPDILMVLGDRYEMHAAALAAIPFNIPLAHIHGGEVSEGSFDEYFRHSLTKLSHLHFASTKEYARRIRQMGEESWRIVVSGAPGLDNFKNIARYSRRELGQKFHINVDRPIVLVTFHPVTKEYEKTSAYITSLLAVLKKYADATIVFTLPNADTYGSLILKEIKKFVSAHRHAYLVENFGQKGYLSIMEQSALLIGNSSSGIIEAASFRLPVVNIGTRQKGRIRNRNVIDVGYSSKEIEAGIQKALSKSFRRSLKGLVNSYGDGKAGKRIVSVLAKVNLEKLIQKRFVDHGA